MEMVFRKIEYLIEGDAPAQRRLTKAPMTFEKALEENTEAHDLHFDFHIDRSHRYGLPGGSGANNLDCK